MQTVVVESGCARIMTTRLLVRITSLTTIRHELLFGSYWNEAELEGDQFISADYNIFGESLTANKRVAPKLEIWSIAGYQIPNTS